MKYRPWDVAVFLELEEKHESEREREREREGGTKHPKEKILTEGYRDSGSKRAVGYPS